MNPISFILTGVLLAQGTPTPQESPAAAEVGDPALPAPAEAPQTGEPNGEPNEGQAPSQSPPAAPSPEPAAEPGSPETLAEEGASREETDPALQPDTEAGMDPAPMRPEEDRNFVHVRFGMGTTRMGRQGYAGPDFSVTYRYEHGNLAFEFCPFEFTSDFLGREEARRWGIVHATGLYFLAPQQGFSPYVGAGAGFSAVWSLTDDQDFDGLGLDVRFLGGIDVGRETGNRLNLQSELVFPAYKIEGINQNTYAPMLLIRAGISFGTNLTIGRMIGRALAGAAEGADEVTR